jgi:aryl-alcohol dehydrogenase-like predicted oxidoreductase
LELRQVPWRFITRGSLQGAYPHAAFAVCLSSLSSRPSVQFSFRTEDFPKELEASLMRLGRNTIDLYQHHFPSKRVSIPRLMELLADAVAAGKVKAVGVSNYSAEQMREAHAALAKRGIPLASNQVEYSLLHRQPETNGVLDACRELGITLIACSAAPSA